MATPSFNDALREVYALARSGRYQPAETLCGELLRQRADHAELWLLRGIILLQTGRAAQAVEAIRESMRRGESRATSHALLGDALAQSAGMAEAIASYHRALQLNPALVSAHLGMGGAMLARGQPAEAVASFEQALRLAPDDADVWCKQGMALLMLGRLAAARQSLDRALALAPVHALAHATRGAVSLKLNECERALEDFDAALLREPHFVEVLCNRAAALRSLSRQDEALHSYEAALKVQPTYLPALRGRAEVLREMHRPREALAGFVHALTLQPNDAETRRGEGDTLLELSRPHDALSSHARALREAPDSSDAHNSHGNSLYALERFDAAIESYRRALALNPSNAVAHYNLGTVLLRVGAEVRGVIEHFTAALDLQPEFPLLQGALAYVKRGIADWSFDDSDAQALERQTLEGRPVAAPFHLLGLSDSPQALKSAAETYLRHRLPTRTASWQPADRGGTRLRVAYVSSDFREHALARLMSGVFEQHDRRLVEAVGVALAPADGSELGRRVRAAFDRLIDVSVLDDEQALQALRTLNLDIAVDLNGFTDGARPSLFQARIAPVQVNYLGFPGTSGADFMDYILADAFVVPFAEQRFYREQVVHLPCFQANDDASLQPVSAAERALEGLPENAFVFCCFNHTSKITPAMFDVWVRILQRVPGSVLWLLGGSLTAENLRREAQRRGLDPGRLHFASRVGRAQFRARLKVADLFLDTLPFNAGATASEVLAAGLPLLSVTGRSFAARMAGSLLFKVGVPQLICNGLCEYESRAVALAESPQELAILRRHLSESGRAADLFDTRSFARSLEQAFVHMHERRLAGLPPLSFKV